MESIPWGVIGPWSGWAAFVALALFCLRAVWVRIVVPAPTHREIVEHVEHDANEWRAEGRIKDQAILTELGVIKSAVLENGETIHSFIESIQKASNKPPEGAP